MSQKRSTGRNKRIDLGLRTPHVNYLEYIAEQEGTSVSAAFGAILEKHAGAALANYKPPRKHLKALSIDPRHVEILSKLATKHGLFGYDMARRLIEEAIAPDKVVGG